MEVQHINQEIQQEEQHPSKSLINVHLIKKVNQNLQTQESENNKVERAISTGMFFPDIVLMRLICDKKSDHSEVIKKDQQYTVTSHSFGNIPIANISKIKIYANKLPKKVVLKIEEEDELKPAIFHVRNTDITQLFSKLLWVRLATMNHFTNLDVCFQKEIEGQVLKFKSIEYFGKWDKRHLKISKEKGFVLSSKQKLSKSVHLQRLSEFWTRFQVIDNQPHLVVKLMAGFFKYQIGIPITSRIIQWMMAFCSIIKQ